MDPSPESFLRLDAMHVQLDEHFLAHQEYLVAGDVASARAELDAFARRLSLHMDQEEAHLLPLLCGTRDSGRDRAEVYRLEHRKIAQLLAGLQGRVADLAERPRARDVIALLDREGLLKRVLEHHGERERSELYPALDGSVAADARRRILDACFAQWARTEPCCRSG